MRALLYPSVILILVTLLGCASTRPPVVYVPEESLGVRCFWSRGVPIMSAQSDSALLLTSIDVCTVADRSYVRTWMLCKNCSQSEFLWDPLAVAQLDVADASGSYPDIAPTPPRELLSAIDSDRTSAMVLQTIGGALEALAQQPTAVTDGTGRTVAVVEDTESKQDAVFDRTGEALAETHQYYQDFRERVDLGSLRKTTVFPGQSVSGFLYFPMPEKPRRVDSADPGGDRGLPLDAEECRFALSVSQPVEISGVEFSPAAGQ